MREKTEKQEMRLDLALPALGLAESREKAKKMIRSGNIYVNDRQVSRPASLVSREDRIEVRGQILPYVSRGGLKLEKALTVFGLDLTKTNLLPHYQDNRDDVLDGLRIYEDIACPDSIGKTFYAIPDGSYLFIDADKREELRGEAYMVRDGLIKQISSHGNVVFL